jgi:hypothetical protein
MTDKDQQARDIAQSIADQIKAAAPNAVVQINPNIRIPTGIGNNLLRLLERVQVTGPEALAWAEAYQYVKQNTDVAAPQGIPFAGLPSARNPDHV